MSCLLNALTAKSKLKDEKGRAEPDQNGGFEMVLGLPAGILITSVIL